MTLKVYLSGRFRDRPDIASRASELVAMGYENTASWLKNTDEGDVDAPPEKQRGWAMQDLRDIDKADVFVAFADPAPERAATRGWYTGGRHVELGYAIASRTKPKTFILVGDPENVFHHLAAITIVPDWHEAVIELGKVLVNHHRDYPRAMVEERAG